MKVLFQAYRNSTESKVTSRTRYTDTQSRRSEIDITQGQNCGTILRVFLERDRGAFFLCFVNC